MQIEQLYLHKGIVCEASEELLAPGFLPHKEDIYGVSKLSNNFFCRKDGELEARAALNVADPSATGYPIYGIWALSTSCFILSNSKIYHKLFASGSFSEKHTMTYGQYLTSGYYKKFLFLKNYYPQNGVYATVLVPGSVSVASSSDGWFDAGYWNPSGSFFPGGAYFSFGQDNWGIIRHAFIRFPAVAIPKGSIINSAHITLYAYMDISVGSNVNAKVYFNNVDNATAPTNTSEANALALTSAVVWHNVESWGEENSAHNTPELKTILQEIVNRSGWSSGNAVMAVIKDDGSSFNNIRFSGGADTTGSYRPVLVVSFDETVVYSYAETNNLMLDASGNAYFPIISAPGSSPSGAAGAGGNPNGTYKLYVSYLITYPNGMKYETGLCNGSSDVTVTSQKISWSNIPKAVVAAIAATGSTPPTIHRKLYRGPGSGGTLADIYYVATITDNTTETYTDDLSDSSLIANGVCDVKNFRPMGYGHIFAFHYGRYYEADYQYPWRLNYSEAAYGHTGADNETIIPIATKATNWNDIRPVAMGSLESITALVSWGTTLYIGYSRGWIKKAGEDPTTWSMKKTSATIGPEHPEWVCLMEKPFGIVFISRDDAGYPGLYVFVGDTAVLVGSPQIDVIMRDLSLTDQTRLRRAGSMLLISGVGTGYSLMLDLSRYPEIRVANFQGYDDTTYGEFSCVEAVKPHAAKENSGKIFGTASGYVLADPGIFTSSTEEQSTGMTLYFPRRNGGEQRLANMTKVLKKLRYNIFPGKYSAGGGSYPYSEARIAVYLDGDTTTVKWGQSGIAYWSVTTEGKGEIAFPPNTRCKTYRIVVSFISDPAQTIGYTYMPKVFMPWDMCFDVVEE
jgi:hypothetical protein